jgi:hypothetical protein
VHHTAFNRDELEQNSPLELLAGFLVKGAFTADQAAPLPCPRTFALPSAHSVDFTWVVAPARVPKANRSCSMAQLAPIRATRMHASPRCRQFNGIKGVLTLRQTEKSMA